MSVSVLIYQNGITAKDLYTQSEILFCYELTMIDNEIENKAIEKYKNSIMDKI